MTSFSFLRQMLQDVRHQKMRTLLTLFGITWGTVSVALLVSFGEALQKRIVKNQHGLGENIVIAWPARTAIPFQGLGKGRKLRVSEDDIAGPAPRDPGGDLLRRVREATRAASGASACGSPRRCRPTARSSR